MVTRTCCFSGVLLSMRSPRPKNKRPRLGGAQLIDLSQQLLDAAAYLLALGLQDSHFLGQKGRLALGFGGLLNSGFALLAQNGYHLHGTLDAIFKTAEGIVFLLGWAHSFSRASRADSFTARADFASSARLRNAASSCSATSASTLRFRSSPAAFSPCTNLL